MPSFPELQVLGHQGHEAWAQSRLGSPPFGGGCGLPSPAGRSLCPSGTFVAGPAGAEAEEATPGAPDGAGQCRWAAPEPAGPAVGGTGPPGGVLPQQQWQHQLPRYTLPLGQPSWFHSPRDLSADLGRIHGAGSEEASACPRCAASGPLSTAFTQACQAPAGLPTFSDMKLHHSNSSPVWASGQHPGPQPVWSALCPRGPSEDRARDLSAALLSWTGSPSCSTQNWPLASPFLAAPSSHFLCEHPPWCGCGAQQRRCTCCRGACGASLSCCRVGITAQLCQAWRLTVGGGTQRGSLLPGLGALPIWARGQGRETWRVLQVTDVTLAGVS